VCWIELQSTDPEAARKFYTSIFGWRFQEMPGGGDGPPYAFASIGEGQNVAGLTELMEGAKQAGSPPHWSCYFQVESAQATADKAAKLGATVVMPPSPMGPGTFAVIRDPAGAHFLLWESKESMGGVCMNETHAFGWAETLSTNADAARGFYPALFGWKAEPGPLMSDYTVFKQGDAQVAGLMQMPKEAAGVPSHWAVYFLVEDVDAMVEKVNQLGGQVVVPPMDIPTVGRFATLTDPQGAAFSILKYAQA
jgi:hypothetical protein